VEFSSKMLQLDPDLVSSSPAFKILDRDYPHHQDAIVKARILAYSQSTWKAHSATFQAFRRFCNVRSINPIDCHPPTIAIYLLD
jgi:hypothetical protein